MTEYTPPPPVATWYPVPEPTEPPPAPRRRRWPWIAGAGALALVAAVVGLSLTGHAPGPTPPRTLTIHYGLIDAEDGGNCSTGGSGGYSDIGPGMPVTVEDEHHDVLASTVIPDHGYAGDGSMDIGCVWTMKVPVPDDRAQYVVTAGRRGAVTYSHDRLAAAHWAAELTIGGDS